jgi:signal peptidase I
VNEPATPAKRTGSPLRLVADYAVTVLVAIALAFLLQAFVVKPFAIPSTSMADTLVIGQRVLVDRVAYHYRDVKRGDIIVFRRPTPENDVLIKRVVGLPGDVLSLRDGKLFVNDTQLDEPYVKLENGGPEPTVPADPMAGGDPNAGWSLEKPFTVPADSYFAMGDNRLDSADSRYWGTVPRDHIIGRAFLTYWPLTRVGGL